MDEATRFDRPSQPLATARWADPAYIATKYPYRAGCIWLGRNPHDPVQAIGYDNDQHVFVNAETRTGKGRSFLINNQVLWPGSMVAVGPKGEEATVAAIRRGSGDDYCVGMDQEVYVLDPLRCADVPDELRAHFNILDALDPNDREFVPKSDEIAYAIATIPEGKDAASWAERGRNWLSVVIQHVMTADYIGDGDRNLITVYDFVSNGDVTRSQTLYNARVARAKRNEEDPETVAKDHPYRLLLNDMIRNEACENVRREAQGMLHSFESNIRLFDSVRTAASDHLQWLAGGAILETVVRPTDGTTNQRTFRVNDLKEKNVSVFIHLPQKNFNGPLGSWVRAMITVLFQGLEAKQGLPSNGHRVLFCIDEFANLGRMEMVGQAVNSIAGAGVKLMIATQRIGDIQERYGKAWEKFVSAAAQIWFGAEEMATREYLERKLGKTEVVKYARSIQKSSSRATGSTIVESYSHTNSQSAGYSKGGNTSTSTTHSRGNSRNYASSDGKSAVRNYGPGYFFHGFEHGLGEGEHSGWSSGRGRTKSTARTSTTGRQYSETTQHGASDTYQRSTSRTETDTVGEAAGVSETFHVKPLLSTTEIREYLSPVDDIEHPAYPGMALVILPGELPFFVRRANYDQDPFFFGKFRPNPAYEFLLPEEQPLFGWQITPEHFYVLRNPWGVHNWSKDSLERGKRFVEGDAMFSWTIRSPGENDTRQLVAPFNLKVIDVFDAEHAKQSGELALLRADAPLREGDHDRLFKHFWGDWDDDLQQRKRHRESIIKESEEYRRLQSLLEEVESYKSTTQLEIERAQQTAQQIVDRSVFLFLIPPLIWIALWAQGRFWAGLGYAVLGLLPTLLLKGLSLATVPITNIFYVEPRRKAIRRDDERIANLKDQMHRMLQA